LSLEVKLLLSIVFFSISLVFTPEWETDIGYIPLGSPLLAANSAGSMDIFVPMGDHGLGGWSGTGQLLNGFPVSVENGVSRRPAAFFHSERGRTIVYADDVGYLHMIDHNGVEIPGWPVFSGQGIVTDISVVDLNDDKQLEISFGTAYDGVYLLDERGQPLPGWPVMLPARLQWQPTQLSLGGNSSFGLVCALVNTSITVLSADGGILPGWPVNPGYSSECIPVTADIDSDGSDDVIFSTYNNRIYAITSGGDVKDGWPFVLDDRTVNGTMAVGHLDPDIKTLQLAVSSIDKGITLINGQGTIAGRWRWPNSTNGVPTSPIITRTSGGSSVIAGCDSGYVYAWNADGARIDGFPFNFGEPITITPVSGDIDGDGNQELVILGMSGRLASFETSLISTSIACWPQMLSDERNSGCYGTSYLPVAIAGRITSETSSGVYLLYTIDGDNVTSISIAFSINAGHSWIETGSFRNNGDSIVWFSDEDIPGQDIMECVLRITPHCPDGPGASGHSNVFHLDNNAPPVLNISSLDEDSPGRFLLQYTIEDQESDVIQLQAQYSCDGGESWETAHLTGNTSEVPSWLYGGPFRWNALADIGPEVIENVILRVRAADEDPGPWSERSVQINGITNNP
jgi:hypothetical protein